MSQPSETTPQVDPEGSEEAPRSRWFLILQSMIARGACTQRILTGAHETWRRIDEEEYADLQDSLAAFTAAQTAAQAAAQDEQPTS